jgi:hypothetical protein
MKTSFLPSCLLVVVLCCSGCLTTERVEVDRTVPPYFKAENTYLAAQGRDAIPRRVLVLPATGRGTAKALRDLDKVLVQELAKANAFEVLLPDSDKVRNRRTDDEFTLQEAEVWAREVGADGILTCQVTSLQSHRPIVLGTALKLWNIPLRSTVWVVDETLDSQLTPVANGARNYYLSNFRVNYPGRRSEQILESPSMFYQYAFAELLSTLPPR